MPLGRVLPHKTNSLGQLAQRHVVLCLFADGVVQHSGVVPRRRKLQRQWPVKHIRHPLTAITQINGQCPTAGQFQLFQLHDISSFYSILCGSL